MNLSMWNLLAQMFFGGVGFVAFVYGKKQQDYKVLAIGVLLMAYPYFVTNTIATCAIGSVLTIALFFFHD